MGGRWIGRLLCLVEDEEGAFSFFVFGLRGVLFGKDWSVFLGFPLCLLADICRSMENVAHIFVFSIFLSPRSPAAITCCNHERFAGTKLSTRGQTIRGSPFADHGLGLLLDGLDLGQWSSIDDNASPASDSDKQYLLVGALL